MIDNDNDNDDKEVNSTSSLERTGSHSCMFDKRF